MTGANGTPGAEPRLAWNEILRAERVRVGLTQVQLAERAGLDAETIRKYEKGARQPSREALDRILGVLQVSIGTAHRILVDRGFYHPDFVFGATAGYYFTEATVAPFVEQFAWPVFVGNELGELIAANRAALALWDVDFAAEARRHGLSRPSLLVAMSEARFAHRLVNRDEILRRFVSLYKAVFQGQASLDNPGAMLGQLLDLVGRYSPRMTLRILQLWTTTPTIEDHVRWTYPVIWHEPGYPEMRFQGVVNPASEPDHWAFNDWIPADAGSHATLERIVADRQGRRPTGA